jgi:hypothetical protein
MGEAKRRKQLDASWGNHRRVSVRGPRGFQPDFGSAVFQFVKDAEFELQIFDIPSFSASYSNEVRRFQMHITPSMFSVQPAIGCFSVPHMATIEWWPQAIGFQWPPDFVEKESRSVIKALQNGAKLKARKDWKYKDRFGNTIIPCQIKR